VLLLVGLPNADPSTEVSGTDHFGQVQLTTNTADLVLTIPVARRFTAARAEKATLVVVNSVVFRSSGQNLTLWGAVVELSRIGDPVLLGLAALAIRGRRHPIPRRRSVRPGPVPPWPRARSLAIGRSVRRGLAEERVAGSS
jgi:hypothetical protein